MTQGPIERAATIAVMLGVVVAFVLATAYMLIYRGDSEQTGILVGALVGAFTLVLNHLFGRSSAGSP